MAAAVLNFGVIADARAIQRRRRIWLGTGLGLLVVLAGAFLALSSFRHAPTHQIAVRIEIRRGPGTPAMENALQRLRSAPGFQKLDLTPRLVTIQPLLRSSGATPVLRIYPMTAIVDARFKTSRSRAQLVAELKKRLGPLVVVESVPPFASRQHGVGFVPARITLK